ncbi:hypothetical protein FACS1894130_03670 [Spirochaetia bacterium]|nr:hypothetical protein FACS1894130_03670 [Spirochaetia bacterium]
MPDNSEIKEIRDACAALSFPNQQRAYEVASALKFAEDRAVTVAGVCRAGDGDGGRDKIKRD